MSNSTCARIIFINLFILLIFASCGTNNSKKEEAKTLTDSSYADTNKEESKPLMDSSIKKPPTEVKTSLAQAMLFEGYLDTLYIEKEVFKKMIGRRLVLKPYINDNGKLTLFGWQAKADDSNDEYEPNNDLKKLELKTGNSSPISFGKKSLLPGVILLGDDFLSVRKALNRRANSDMKYVVFCPAGDPQYPGQYIYNIVLTDYEPILAELEIKTIKAITPVIVSANPSPPRNS